MLAQLYADDIQAYQHCVISDALVTVSAMSRTMEARGPWMSSNHLLLNPHKTQFIWLGTCQQLAKLHMVALTSAFSHFTSLRVELALFIKAWNGPILSRNGPYSISSGKGPIYQGLG